jgi:myo-inositol-1(or 4)-monophosphatase
MNLEKIAESAIALSRKIGDFILAERDKVQASDVEIKDLNSLVSYVDKDAERQLVEGLKGLLPEAGFIAEEGTGTEQEDYNWIIDPLDGTTNFLFGLPIFAISIALMHKDEALIGIVYELGQKEMFSALKGQGAFMNAKRIRVSQRRAFEEALFATGFPYYDFSRTEGFMDLLKYMFAHTRGVRRLGSAATDLAYVACGRFDGFFEYGLSPWDVAGGALLVKEAGGMVSDYASGGDYIFGKEIAAASEALHPEMMKQIKHFMGN